MAGSDWIVFDGIGLIIVLTAAASSFVVAWATLGITRLWDYYLLVLLLAVLVVAIVAVRNMLLFYVVWEVAAFVGWGIGRWASAGYRQSMMGPLPLQGFGALGSLGMAVALLVLALQSRNLGTQGPQGADVGLFTTLLLGAVILKSFALLSPAWYPSRDEQSFYVAHATLAGGGLLAIGLFPYLRFLAGSEAAPAAWRGPALAVGLAIALLLALAALGETDLHKILAYATFSQYGGLLAFFAAVPPADWAQSALALLPYGLGIAGLTMSLGAVSVATGQRDLRQLGGLFRQMPLNAGLLLLSGLALAGIAPLGGFTSRLGGTLALLRGGESTAAYLFLGLAAATLLYVLRLFREIFVGEDAVRREPLRAAPRGMVLMAGALVVGVLFIGMQPGPTLSLVKAALETTVK